MRPVTIYDKTTRQKVLSLVEHLNKSNKITLRELTEYLDNNTNVCACPEGSSAEFLMYSTGVGGRTKLESKSMGGGCNYIGFSTLTVAGKSGTSSVCDFIGHFSTGENQDLNLLVLIESCGVTGEVGVLYSAYSNKHQLFAGGDVGHEKVREMIKRQIARSFNGINSIDKFLAYIGFTKH